MASSLRSHVSGLLDEYADLVHQFFRSLTPLVENSTTDNETHQTPELLAKRIIEVDDRLQVALDQVQEHQGRQQRIALIQNDIQQQQLALLGVIRKLDAARENLDSELTKAKKEMAATRYAQQANVDFSTILSYAFKLSKYTSAPPNFNTMSRDLQIDLEKPYPDEERMRRGILYFIDSNGRPNIQDDKLAPLDIDSPDEGTIQPKNTVSTMQSTNGQTKPFWILDLNPDLAS